MLIKVETEARRIGLFINSKKTEGIQVNYADDTLLATLDGSLLKNAKKFQVPWIMDDEL